jgi:hypothetical protein
MEQKELQEFLYFFTHNKSLTRAQQFKRDVLLARDFVKNTGKSDGLPESKVKDESDKDKNVVPKDHSGKHRSGVIEGTKYTSPKNLQLFLREFNQDDVLKYTCHQIDTDEVIDSICKECSNEKYDFAKHSELIRKHFELLTQKFKQNEIHLDSKMYALISTYLTGTSGKKDQREKKDWSSNGIDINWNSPQILEWAKEHPHIVPAPGKNIAKKQKSNGYTLPYAFKSNITGTRIKSFTDLVIFFKSQFHIRKDNSLRTILEKVSSKWKPEDVQISFVESEFNDSVELFTDVDKLIQAYQKIVEICIENRSEDNEPIQIQLSFYDDAETKSTFFCIHHLNTVYKKTSKNSTERIGTAHSNLISKQINGLSDLYIEARFGDGVSGRLNLWDGNDEFKFQSLQEDITGVKYILRF